MLDVIDVADVADVSPPDNGPMDVPDGPALCSDTRFIRPMSGTVLGVADDADRNCSNGFAFDVQLSTNAPVGMNLELRVNGRVASTARVTGSVVTFSGVMLDTRGMSTLEIWQDGVMMACASASVSVNCDTPRCQIATPTRSSLNIADNTSPGMPFTTNFAVGTDIEDGREVELFVSNRTSSLRAAVMGGMAAFSNVPLSPDGSYRVRAVCTNRAGNTGMSAEGTFTVDNTAPTLDVSRPMANATIGVSADSNQTLPGVQYQVCGRSDATGQQLCAAASGAMPTCVTVASATADTCVELTCPSGSASFALEVTARDEAGNVTRRAVAGVHCQSSLPSVRIAAPAAYDPTNPLTILNASRDADPATAGFQGDVVACTDRMGGTASLFFNGATTPTGMPVTVAPTAMGDPCAMLGAGFVGIARFPRVTIPQTFPVVARAGVDPVGPTVEVAVTDSDDTGRSAAVRLFVDSEPPAVTIASCGLVVAPGAGGTGTSNIDVNSDVYPVTLTLTHTGSTPMTLPPLTAPSLPAGRGTFVGVVFQPGVTNLALTATDPAGNSTTTTNPCTVEVGNPPTLSFTMPTAGQVFSSTSSTNITLRSDAPVGTVITLTVGTGTPIMSTVAAGGTVAFNGVMLPQGDAVAINAVTATVAGRGVGHAMVTVVVDTLAPTPPTAFTAVVPTTPASARRAGTVHFTWLDGSDPAPGGTGTRAVSRYEFRYSTIPLTTANYLMAPILAVTTTPGAPGAMNQADVAGLELEQSYYFAIRSVDRAGLFSSTAPFTTVAVTPSLVRDTIVDAPVALGNAVSGGFDVNGDSFADVVVASGITSGSFGGIARVYFGSATGLSATRYAEFRGAAANRFGSSAVSLGDVNGDGLGDIAVGEPGPAASTALAPGAVHIFFGRRTWNAPPAFYTSADADVTIGGGTGEFAPSSLGFQVARAGDFNGDGIADIAASAPQSNGHGAVVVVFGRATFARTITPNAADVIIRNTSTDTFFGIYLAGGGRLVGGDTREDLLVGGNPTGYGTLAVFAGRAAATPISLAQTDAALNRPGVMNAAMDLGQFVAGGVGDVNGDGRSDLAVGTGIRGPGEVTLYFGDTSGGLMAGPTITSTSVQTADVFGIRLASIYDPRSLHPSLLLPSPSGADLLVGSAAYGGGNPTLYIYPGRATWTGQTTDTARQRIAATAAASQPINGVNWVGDVDGDGYTDAAYGRSGAGTLIILR